MHMMISIFIYIEGFEHVQSVSMPEGVMYKVLSGNVKQMNTAHNSVQVNYQQDPLSMSITIRLHHLHTSLWVWLIIN